MGIQTFSNGDAVIRIGGVVAGAVELGYMSSASAAWASAIRGAPGFSC